jgi:hypothetical protein
MDISRRTWLAASLATPALPAWAALPELVPPAPAIEWKARWVWFPERRTLPCTFILFRRVVEIESVPAQAPAWVSGHSRYQLFVNGKFLQRGPAPCDPRYWDVDPIDLAPHLRPGRNVIAAVVCAFGSGDGTYVPPAPVGSGEGQGFLFQCDALHLATDSSWKSLRPRCWPHGSHPRWFLRALQEEFDARHFPEHWAEPGFDDSAWLPVSVSNNRPGRPSLREVAREGWQADWVLQPRTIPPLIESLTPPRRLHSTGWIDWLTSPEEYFECYPPNAFRETEDNSWRPSDPAAPFTIPAPGARSAVVTVDFGTEVLGHPRIRLRAPAGTIVELLFCEMQTPGKLLLRSNTKYGQWLRIICREGITEYEAFEYDCFRMLQLCVRNSDNPVEILQIATKTRAYAWPNQPDFQCSDPDIQRAYQASVQTHSIVSQETLVDNCVRERQQYAGDLDHAKLGSYYAFGETRQPARMLRTFAQGQNREGWFMDSWPAWDRCQRLFQKHLSLTTWGPILDHALQYGIAAAEHYLWDADRALIDSLTPRLELFARFLEANTKADGLLPVLHWNWNTIWLDHIGFHREEDKHCAWNIYWAGFLKQGLARLQEWTGQPAKAAATRARAEAIFERVRKLYWSDAEQLFIDNLPRRAQDPKLHVHARTLSMALLFGAIPPGHQKRCVEMLHSFPTTSSPSLHDVDGGRISLGMNYPLNDIWRLWALGAAGLGANVVADLRDRWSRLPSVMQNGTYAEDWDPKPSEAGSIWCQSNPVPIIALYQIVLGVHPTEPGFAAYELRPQPGDLRQVSGTVFTKQGPIHVAIDGKQLHWTSPGGVKATLVLPSGARRVMPASPRPQEWKLSLDA